MASLTRFHERGGAVSDTVRKILQAFCPLAVSLDSTVKMAS